MELVVLLTITAAVVWVLTSRGILFTNSSIGMTIFWILMAGAVIGFLLELAGGGPPGGGSTGLSLAVYKPFTSGSAGMYQRGARFEVEAVMDPPGGAPRVSGV